MTGSIFSEIVCIGGCVCVCYLCMCMYIHPHVYIFSALTLFDKNEIRLDTVHLILYLGDCFKSLTNS